MTKPILRVVAFVFATACMKTESPPAADTAATPVAEQPAAATPPADSTSTSSPVTTDSGSRPDSLPANPPAKWIVNLRGIGAIAAGMTLPEANNVSGNLLIIPAKLEECQFIRAKNAPEGLMFMVEKGKISRVDVTRNSTIVTTTGAKIGDTEERIKSLYPNQVTVQPHKYTDGHYLVVTPKNADGFRIIFETDGKKVLRYRSGLLPGVEYVEGCS